MNCYQCTLPVDLSRDEYHTFVIDSIAYAMHDKCVAVVITQYIIQCRQYDNFVEDLAKREEVIGNA